MIHLFPGDGGGRCIAIWPEPDSTTSFTFVPLTKEGERERFSAPRRFAEGCELYAFARATGWTCRSSVGRGDSELFGSGPATQLRRFGLDEYW